MGVASNKLFITMWNIYAYINSYMHDTKIFRSTKGISKYINLEN